VTTSSERQTTSERDSSCCIFIMLNKRPVFLLLHASTSNQCVKSTEALVPLPGFCCAVCSLLPACKGAVLHGMLHAGQTRGRHGPQPGMFDAVSRPRAEGAPKRPVLQRLHGAELQLAF